MTPTVKLAKDRSGYLLGDEPVDGFDDRTDVPDPVRYRIAHWASLHTPDQLTDGQRDLIKRVLSRERPASARRARRQSRMLRSPVIRALWGALAEDDQRVVLEVDVVLGEGVGYPLTSGQLARLTSIEQATIRRWDLPNTRDERGRREYGPAAAVIAFTLKGTKQNSREYYRDITKSAAPLHELRRSIALATHSAFASQKPPGLDEAVAKDLEALSREMSVLSEMFGRAASAARDAGISGAVIASGEIASAPETGSATINNMVGGKNLRDLGEEIELLDPTADLIV